MSKVAVIGTLQCREGKSEEMEAMLAAMVDAARDEPGVEIYSYHRGEGHMYWFFALMTDAEAMRKHGKGEAMRAAMSAFGTVAVGTPQMAVTTPIAALGLPL